MRNIDSIEFVWEDHLLIGQKSNLNTNLEIDPQIEEMPTIDRWKSSYESNAMSAFAILFAIIWLITCKKNWREVTTWARIRFLWFSTWLNLFLSLSPECCWNLVFLFFRLFYIFPDMRIHFASIARYTLNEANVRCTVCEARKTHALNPRVSKLRWFQSTCAQCTTVEILCMVHVVVAVDFRHNSSWWYSYFIHLVFVCWLVIFHCLYYIACRWFCSFIC